MAMDTGCPDLYFPLMPAAPPLPVITLCPGHATVLFDAPPGWSWRTRIGNHCNLWLALDGRGRLRTGGVDTDIGAGAVCLLAPGQEVEIVHDRRRPLRNFSAHFTLADGADALPATVVRQVPLHDLQPLAMQAFHAAASGDPLGWMQATHLVSAMLCLVMRRSRDDHRDGAHAAAVRLVAEEIRLHPERPWPLAAVSARLGLSPAQAARSFRAATGSPVARFVIRCRMERAVRLLVETDLPVSTVGTLSGYADVYYFSRHFKAVIGTPPTRFRRSGDRQRDGT